MPEEKASSSGAFLPASLMYFCSGQPMHFCCGVDKMVSVYEIWDLRGSGAFAKELVRAVVRNALKEIGEGSETRVLAAFTQQRKFWTMKGEAVDLSVIQFQTTDCFGWRK